MDFLSPDQSRCDVDKVELQRKDGKKGLVMLRDQYDQVCRFILTMLESKETTLTGLLSAGSEELRNKFPREAWVILNVKRDLEIKGIIKLKYTGKCTQVISLARNQDKKTRTVL